MCQNQSDGVEGNCNTKIHVSGLLEEVLETLELIAWLAATFGLPKEGGPTTTRINFEPYETALYNHPNHNLPFSYVFVLSKTGAKDAGLELSFGKVLATPFPRWGLSMWLPNCPAQRRRRTRNIIRTYEPLCRGQSINGV